MEKKYADGRKYSGKGRNGKPHGAKGTMEYPDGAEYFGEFKDGKFHGDGHMTYSNGFRYNGGWKDNKKHGDGVLNWPDGTKYDCKWIEDKRQGRGKIHWPDGTSYDGYFKNNKQHGTGIFRVPGRSKYKGEWLDNKMHGRGIISFPDSIGENGRLSIEGEWEENKFCSGKVTSLTTKMEREFLIPIGDHTFIESYDKDGYSELTRKEIERIKLIIKQKMVNSENQLLREYGELIFNGDKPNIAKFAISTDVKVRSYAVTRVYRDLPTEESTNGTLSPVVLFNPFVTMREKENMIAAALAHEAAHVSKGHINRKNYKDENGRWKDYNLSNIADDLIINEELKKAGILNGDENMLFLDHPIHLSSRRSWMMIMEFAWDKETLKNDLTENRIYETLIKRRNEFTWNI